MLSHILVLPLILSICLAAILGLVLGSFSGATIWRLRARQLVEDKVAGEKYDKTEYKRLLPLTKSTVTNDRSRCLHCHHTLAWFDLLPLVSWLSTRGKCRYCKAPIGQFEPLIELGTALVFAVMTYAILTKFGWFSPFAFVYLGLWLVAVTMFVILFVYDAKWFLLPDVIMFPLIVVSIVISAATFVFTRPHDLSQYLLSTVASVAILSGLYFVLWLISKGRWVGFGDVKLGIALGLLVVDWRLAFLVLFLANLIGTLTVLPGLVRGSMSRQTQIPFGPLLITAFFIAILFGNHIINGYIAATNWLSMTLLML